MRRLSRFFENLFLFAALLLVARGLVLSSRGLPGGEAYTLRRDEVVFLGLNMEGMRGVMDKRLAPETPVQLGGSLYTDREFGAAFWFRATAGLYPRRVEPAASHKLEIGPDVVEGGVRLGALTDGRVLSLTGPPDPRPGPSGNVTSDFDPAALVAGALGLCGLGVLLMRALRIPRIDLPSVAVGGGLALALSAHIATWLQRPLSLEIVMALGMVGILVALSGVSFKEVSKTPPPGSSSPWLLLPVSAVILVVLRSLLVPATEWDGRFVWLVHAQQLFFDGFLDLSERSGVGRLQPTYPLLTPALFAFGSSFREAFNDRTAVVLLVAFHGAVIASIAKIAVKRIGPFRGAVFSTLTAAATLGSSGEAYADGVLSALLVLQFLALESPEHARFGWLVMAAAALTKREGLILSVIVALAQKGRSALKPMLGALAPALAHVLWCRFVGLAHELDAPRLAADVADLAGRSVLILRQAAGAISRNLTYALAAAALVPIALARAVSPLAPTTRSAFSVGLAFCAFIFVTFLVTPQPLPWHLWTALPRLALHPALFWLWCGFSLRRDPNPDSTRPEALEPVP